MSDPYGSRWAITDDWEDHIARGTSLGGTDFAIGVGTPIPVPRAGRVQNIPYNGSGGHTCRFWVSDNAYFEFMHLSNFVANGYYDVGQTIGYSGGRKGADGAGSSTGPHVHIHAVIDGKRYRYNTLLVTTASSGNSPIKEKNEEIEMKNSGFYFKNSVGNWIVVIMNTTSGFFTKINLGPDLNYHVTFNNAIAATFNTGNFALINQTLCDQFEAECKSIKSAK